MKDFELYQQILGLVGPWRVESVTLKTQQREIEVRVGVDRHPLGMPAVSAADADSRLRRAAMAPFGQLPVQTIIVARVPMVRCPEHGTQTVAVPWAEKYARFSSVVRAVGH